MIFAHGPWWSEWHHIIPWLPATVPIALAWFASWRSVRKMHRSKEDE